MGNNAEHLSRVLSWTIEVRNLIARDFQCSGDDETAPRFLILWYSGHVARGHELPAALSTDRERTKLVDREESLVFLKITEDSFDVIYLLAILRIVDVSTLRALRQRHPAERVISRTICAQTGVPCSLSTLTKSAIRQVVRLIPAAEGGSCRSPKTSLRTDSLLARRLSILLPMANNVCVPPMANNQMYFRTETRLIERCPAIVGSICLVGGQRSR